MRFIFSLWVGQWNDQQGLQLVVIILILSPISAARTPSIAMWDEVINDQY